jgi:murein DD-endopeptidase MepM/ murein hydrolase activator NlpD
MGQKLKFFLKVTFTSLIFLFVAVVNYGCGQTAQKPGEPKPMVTAGPVSYSGLCEQNKDQAYAYLMKKAKFIGVTASLYELKPRENLWTVAKKYGVDINTIVGANFELKDLKSRIGQKIIVMSERGVLHEVKAGTPRDLKTIEMLYGVLPEDITNYNKIGWWISEGDILFIHDAKPVDLKPELAALYTRRKIFRSPLTGYLTSFFGKRHDPIIKGFTEFHNGVDIGVKVGAWVAAAADGEVIYAGWENGFGNTVKIMHANGYSTLYGHLSKIFVKVGQKVKKGKLIAKSGNTGRSTGPHLHFSIFKDGVAQNPLDYIW